jgi:hypothetical protein
VSDPNGVVIPKSADVGGDGPMKLFLQGDEAAALIDRLYTQAAELGYTKVRLDRAKHEPSGAWFELGYVYGEVSVRWSHRQANTALRHNDESADAQFLTFLQDNQAFAQMGDQS